MRVRVESAARLHMGFIDLHGGLGRKFGSIGVALEQPQLILEATPAGRITVVNGSGEASVDAECERAEEFARRFYAACTHTYAAPTPPDACYPRVHIQIQAIIPPHQGLGSGTQLALAVGAALAKLHGVETGAFELARVMARGKRSSIGIGAFQQGGFLVDAGRMSGGRTSDSAPLSPIVVRRPFPGDWRFVIVNPGVAPGLSGDEETQAFVEMPRPSPEHAGQIARLVMMQMLPALAERDIARFGASLTQIQRLVGDCFAPVQGGRYANPLSAELIDFLLDQGAAGAGQSSWGPTVYGLVEGTAAAQALEDRVRAWIAARPADARKPAAIYRSRVANEGARVHVIP